MRVIFQQAIRCVTAAAILLSIAMPALGWHSGTVLRRRKQTVALAAVFLLTRRLRAVSVSVWRLRQSRSGPEPAGPSGAWRAAISDSRSASSAQRSTPACRGGETGQRDPSGRAGATDNIQVLFRDPFY